MCNNDTDKIIIINKSEGYSFYHNKDHEIDKQEYFSDDDKLDNDLEFINIFKKEIQKQLFKECI